MYRKKNILHKILLAYDKDFVSAHKYYILINIKVCPKHNKKNMKIHKTTYKKQQFYNFIFFYHKIIHRKKSWRKK